MDTDEAIVVTGCHALQGDPRDGDELLRWLVSRKSRKYMGKQDELAVIGAGRALEQAGLLGSPRLQDMAVYLTVGHIPFERADIEAIARHSVDGDGGFSISSFSLDGIEQVNPLLTFRCLPNMPAYHLSVNFDLRGGYAVGYPDIAQCYASLEQACIDLRSGGAVHALLGAVADQANFLVDFGFARHPALCAHARRDEAAMLCLELASTARARGAPVLARLGEVDIVYRGSAADDAPLATACTALGADLHAALAGDTLPWRQVVRSPDGCRLASHWERA